MTLTRAGVLVLAAFSIPVAIELRTLFGFFGVELPLVAVAAFEAVLLGAILVAYARGDGSKRAASH